MPLLDHTQPEIRTIGRCKATSKLQNLFHFFYLHKKLHHALFMPGVLNIGYVYFLGVQSTKARCMKRNVKLVYEIYNSIQRNLTFFF